MMLSLTQTRIAVIGLGYVGLPLAVAFGRRYPTLGFDINDNRISELRSGRDATREVDARDLSDAHLLRFSHAPSDLADCNVFVVTVPTPIDDHRRPDLRPLTSATQFVADAISPGALAIYESTVYPGATEEICVPIIERRSGLRYNVDFFCGYSPERINPGDKTHRLANIVKITSGSRPEIADYVDALYRSIIAAGTHRASSIRVAEAAKVIENTQRDVNIALVNELALIFERLGVDTQEILDAAGSKWNFLPFRPGLVGGHCIGVDPYYLTYKAEAIGYHPEMILAGRRINDAMGSNIAQRVMKLMACRGIHVVGAKILVLGLTFKENCPDLRNTRVVDIIKEFQSYSASVDVYDPWADPEEAQQQYGLALASEPSKDGYDAIVVAVAHKDFVDMGPDRIRRLGKPQSVIMDVKHILPRDIVDARL